MSNDIARQATDDCYRGNVESKEVALCHFFKPSAVSLALRYLNTGGMTDAIPAAMSALGSDTPAAAMLITATRNALAHEPAAVFNSFIILHLT